MPSTSPLNSGSHSPNSPISPKSTPIVEGYFNPLRPENPRLESIAEHLKADHAQGPRTSFASTISCKPMLKISHSYVEGTVRSRLPSLIKDASPPPARYSNLSSAHPRTKSMPPKLKRDALRGGSTHPTLTRPILSLESARAWVTPPLRYYAKSQVVLYTNYLVH